MTTIWYTSPDQPGAPVPGDLVVGQGPVRQLLRWAPSIPLGTTAYAWLKIGRTEGWAAKVRRPTPEELAVYQLAQGSS